MPLSIDDTLKGTFLEDFFFQSCIAAHRLGNDFLSLRHFEEWFKDVGFEEVSVEQFALPLNYWPKGRYKAIGELQNANLTEGMGGIYTRMMSKGLGWTEEKIEGAIEKAFEGINDRRIHAYFPV